LYLRSEGVTVDLFFRLYQNLKHNFWLNFLNDVSIFIFKTAQMNTSLIINNDLVETQNYTDALSPQDRSLLAKVAVATTDQVDLAFNAAKNAFPAWKNLPAHERMYKMELIANEILRRKDELAQSLCAEIAKPLRDSIKEVERSAEYLLFTTQAFRNIEGRVITGDKMPGYNLFQKTGIVTYEPMGVILAISPFNYPINLAITKIAPALVTGNTMIFKPASAGAATAFILSQIISNLLPPGVFNFISGKSSEIGDYLLTHPDLSMTAFTGSTSVGRHIQKVSSVPLYLEMGGKDAAIILADADLEMAASEIIKGGFSYSAQRCTAVKRIILHDDVADEFISLLKDKISKLTLGRAEENADITSLIDSKTTEYVIDLISDAREKGAQILTGGNKKNGIIVPTLCDYVTKEMRLYTEEPFGPVLPIIRIKSVEDALEKANDSKYGLQADIFTQNINTAFYIANNLNAGTVQINGKSDRGPDNFPFPGIKDSGMGVAGIRDALYSMMRIKMIVVNS